MLLRLVALKLTAYLATACIRRASLCHQGLFDAVAAVSASSDPGAGLIAQPTSADGGSALRPEFVAGFVTEHGGTQSYLSPERVLDEEDYWSPEAFKAFLDAGAVRMRCAQDA